MVPSSAYLRRVAAGAEMPELDMESEKSAEETDKWTEMAAERSRKVDSPAAAVGG